MAKEELDKIDPSLRGQVSAGFEAMDFLDALTENSNAMIPEPTFKEHLLPVLVKRGVGVDLSKWQEYAGHVMRAINVYEPKTGEVLFTVPPLLKSYEGESFNLEGESIREILITARLHHDNLPNMGLRYLDAKLTQRLNKNTPNSNDVKAWNDILIRYGYEPIFNVEVVDKSVETTTDTTDLGISGYEDL